MSTDGPSTVKGCESLPFHLGSQLVLRWLRAPRQKPCCSPWPAFREVRTAQQYATTFDHGRRLKSWSHTVAGRPAHGTCALSMLSALTDNPETTVGGLDSTGLLRNESYVDPLDQPRRADERADRHQLGVSHQIQAVRAH